MEELRTRDRRAASVDDVDVVVSGREQEGRNATRLDSAEQLIKRVLIGVGVCDDSEEMPRGDLDE